MRLLSMQVVLLQDPSQIGDARGLLGSDGSDDDDDSLGDSGGASGSEGEGDGDVTGSTWSDDDLDEFVDSIGEPGAVLRGVAAQLGTVSASVLGAGPSLKLPWAATQAEADGSQSDAESGGGSDGEPSTRTHSGGEVVHSTELSGERIAVGSEERSSPLPVHVGDDVGAEPVAAPVVSNVVLGSATVVTAPDDTGAGGDVGRVVVEGLSVIDGMAGPALTTLAPADAPVPADATPRQASPELPVATEERGVWYDRVGPGSTVVFSGSAKYGTA